MEKEKIIVNGYEIFYNSFWEEFQMWHDEIGFIGSYSNLEDAIEDAKKG